MCHNQSRQRDRLITFNAKIKKVSAFAFRAAVKSPRRVTRQAHAPPDIFSRGILPLQEQPGMYSGVDFWRWVTLTTTATATPAATPAQQQQSRGSTAAPPLQTVAFVSATRCFGFRLCVQFIGDTCIHDLKNINQTHVVEAHPAISIEQFSQGHLMMILSLLNLRHPRDFKPTTARRATFCGNTRRPAQKSNELDDWSDQSYWYQLPGILSPAIHRLTVYDESWCCEGNHSLSLSRATLAGRAMIACCSK